jgi:hypothetical protein
MLDGIPARRRGDSILGVGNEGHLCWAYLLDEFTETLDRVTLDIEFGRYVCLEFSHVGVTYVASIGARVYGDAVGTKTLDIQ